ncbi:MAG TPA: hypothetical protein VFZ41_11225 [Solirubrobacterales bacterium]
MRRLPRTAGTFAALAAAIVVAGCGGDSEETAPSEPFEPQGTLRAVGGTTRGEKPAFVFRVDARPGDTNIRSAEVILPPVVLVDVAAIGRLCSRRELRSKRCEGRQRFGFARAVSPAYRAPLSGPVYAVSGFGRLPHLAYVLGGPANLLLEGRVVSEGGRIGAGVDDVPDTPLEIFELRIDGGKRAYLVLSRNICAGEAAAADATFTSHEGQVVERKIPLMADCG